MRERSGSSGVAVSLLDPPRRNGLGNAVFLVHREGDAPLVLKVYRPKMCRFNEIFCNLWMTRFQRRHGIDAAARARGESRCLELWSRHGFDVFCPADGIGPSGLEEPCLWLEYLPGRRLLDVFLDPALPVVKLEDLVHRLGATIASRHDRAEELDDCRLAHYNGAVKHIWVHEDRLITFDLEGGFLRGFPVEPALARELMTFVRSLDGYDRISLGRALDAFVAGYGNPDRLKRLVSLVTTSLRPYHLVTRLTDSVKRRGRSKTNRMKRLQERLL